MLNTTAYERRTHVARMRHNFALEGLKPDASDASLQLAYMSGKATLADMLAHAIAYATALAGRTTLQLSAAA